MSEETAEAEDATKSPQLDQMSTAIAEWLTRLFRPRFGWLVALVLIAGFVLRFWGVSWDQYSKLHPDERFLTMVEVDLKVPHSLGQYFDTDESPLNPYNTDRGSFAYGTLPIFLTKITGEVLQHQDFFPLNLLKDGLEKAFVGPVPQWNDYAHINLVGRLLSTLFDVATIYVVYLTGRLMVDRRFGLLAAALLAATVLHIQLAHFFAVDSFLGFFAALTIYFAIKIVKFGRWSDFAWAGLCFGFAVACKLSGVFLGPVLFLAVVQRGWSPALRLLREGRETALSRAKAAAEAALADAQPLESDPGRPDEASPPIAAPPSPDDAPAERVGPPAGDLWPVLRLGLAFALTVFVAFVAFRVAQPYAWEGLGGLDTFTPSKTYIDDMKNNALLQEGADFPPNWEWVGRATYLFPLENMVFWGMGLPLGIAAWGGFLWAAWRLVRHRDTTNLLLLAWVTLFFGFWGRSFNPTMRYFLPVYPALVLLGTYALRELWHFAQSERLRAVLLRWAFRLQPYAPAAIRATVVAVVALTALWALAFTNIYRQPLSRVQASVWMIDNLPAKSTLTCEHWDDCVPFSTKGKASDFNIIQIEPYGADLGQPDSKMLATLDQAEYLVISSNRLYGSIPRTPAKWPVTSKFYDLLLADKLPGFRLVREFTAYPSILGVTIPDSAAEGNFTVYDHPKVLLFQKTEDYSAERLMAGVGDVCLQVPARTVVPSGADQNGLLMREDACATQREGGTWTSIFDPGSLTNRFPLITWILVIELMSLGLLPVALVVFRALPDRGYLLAKPLGLLAVSWLAWLGASVHVVDFDRDGILLAFLIVLLLGSAVNRWSGNIAHQFLRERWRTVLLCEALFLGAWLVFYWIRIVNPDLWHPFRGGEKPMELAYLNAVTRSTTMPPYDPWLAGGYLNYYYFGQFMTATLVKFTGTLPEIGFNLAVPMYFALAVGTAYSVVFNLAEATRRFVRWRPGFRRIGTRGPVVAGLLGAVMVAVVGNLHGLYQTANRFDSVSDWHLGHGIPLLSGLVGLIGGVWKYVTEGGVTLPPFDYWEPSRMMPPQSSITEFPFFTFLFADLHAHLMAIPFDIAIVGVCLALVLGGKSGVGGRLSGQATSWLGVIVLGLLVGALRPINSWDYPPFLLLGAAAIVIGERAMAEKISGRYWGRALLKVIALGLLSILFFLPFWQDYHLFYKGFHATDETTPFHQYLAHFGLLLFATGTLVAVFAWRAIRRAGALRSAWAYALAAVGVLAVILLFMLLSDQTERLPIVITGLKASDFLSDLTSNEIPVVMFALLVIAGLLALGWREFRVRRADAPLRLYVLVMIGLALALSAGVDLLTLDGDIARMNTVFKFYVHIWILLALAGAFGVWYVFTVLRGSPSGGGARQPWWTSAASAKGLWVVVFAVLLLGSLTYTVSGTRARVSSTDRFEQYHGHSINGMEYMRYAVWGDEHGEVELAYDYDAIQWMRENVEGSPVIVEAQTPGYRWGSRFSIYAGLPAVVGWGWHQQQQRGEFGYMVKDREKEVLDFYSTPDTSPAIDFLRKYRVSYVVVGQLERGYYPPEGIAKFEAMNGRELQLVYQNPGIDIYRVLELPPLVAAVSEAQ